MQRQEVAPLFSTSKCQDFHSANLKFDQNTAGFVFYLTAKWMISLYRDQ